jgi:hypothetical protein
MGGRSGGGGTFLSFLLGEKNPGIEYYKTKPTKDSVSFNVSRANREDLFLRLVIYTNKENAKKILKITQQ